MAKRKGLGKGLGALIPDKPTIDENEILNKNTENQVEDLNQIIQNISISDIEASGDNPRKNFDDEALESLAESIKLYGILQPLVLLKEEDKYTIVAGERRYRAAKLAKLKVVPAIVKDLSETDKDMVSMIENIQREDLNPYEEAQAYSNIMKKYDLTQNELSEKIGKTRTYIANIVRLLSLDDFTVSELEKGNITSSQGRALLGVKDIFERKKYLEMLIRNEITVNEIEKKSTKRRKPAKDIYVKDLEERLKESFGTKVNVKKSKNKWVLNFEFSDDEQVENFLHQFGIGE